MKLFRYLVKSVSLMLLLVVCYWLGNITYPYLLMTFGTGISAAAGALAIAYVPLVLLYLFREDD